MCFILPRHLVSYVGVIDVNVVYQVCKRKSRVTQYLSTRRPTFTAVRRWL